MRNTINKQELIMKNFEELERLRRKVFQGRNILYVVDNKINMSANDGTFNLRDLNKRLLNYGESKE